MSVFSTLFSFSFFWFRQLVGIIISSSNSSHLRLPSILFVLKVRLLLILMAFLAFPAFTQTNTEAEQKTIVIKRLEDNQTIRLDGIINEAFWLNMEPISDFVMKVPIEGGQPTERTEVRIAYDRENLYMAVILYDKEPEKIKAFQKKRDEDIETEDSFTWIFDTYLDKRNAYLFSTNPLGLRNDALLTTGQGSSINKNWDGIWDLKTNIGDYGWSVEVKIPFRTLNFGKNQDTWGINFSRIVRRKNEEVLWMGYRLRQGIDRPQDAGLLTGLIDISQGIGLEAQPYGIIRTEKIGDNPSETSTNAGLDINYNITPNLKASLTFNTDFAETEVDDRQVNLTRFPIQFPEKRDFFLEGAGIYSYAPRSGINPFFSRRIGLRNGRPIPIRYGARILGRVGNLDMAVLQVRTGEKGGFNAEDFTVARFKQNIGKESTIGLVYTRRSTEDGDQLQNPLQDRHTFGTDLQLNTSTFLKDKNLQFQAFFAFHNPASPIDDESDFWNRTTRGFRLNFPNRPWFAHCSYREFGDAFDPAVGFNQRNGLRRVEPAIGFSPIFEKSRLIRQITWRILYQNLWDLDFKLLTQILQLRLADILLESGESISFQLIRNYERLQRDFDILRDESIIIPIDEYITWTLNIRLSSATFRRVVGFVDFRKGGFWSGNRTRWQLGAILRPFSGLNLTADFTRSIVDLEEGDFTADLLKLEASYDITPDLSIASILQFDNLSNVLGMNHRFRWIIRPGSDVFIVYNHNWVKDLSDYRLLDRAVVLKANYTHRF